MYYAKKQAFYWLHINFSVGPEPQPPALQDDFIIGDRVWVGGTKPGKHSFIYVENTGWNETMDLLQEIVGIEVAKIY